MDEREIEAGVMRAAEVGIRRDERQRCVEYLASLLPTLEKAYAMSGENPDVGLVVGAVMGCVDDLRNWDGRPMAPLSEAAQTTLAQILVSRIGTSATAVTPPKGELN